MKALLLNKIVRILNVVADHVEFIKKTLVLNGLIILIIFHFGLIQTQVYYTVFMYIYIYMPDDDIMF